MSTPWQDLRYSLRVLVRAPGFTAVAVLTLALGIGINTAMFSILSALLLRPYPYPDADRLVVVRMHNDERNVSSMPVSFPDFVDVAERSRSFAGVAAVGLKQLNLAGGAGESVRLTGARASASLFEVLGAQTVLGRTFTAEEDRPGAEKVVVLDHGLWQRVFGSDPGIVGRSVRLHGEPHTITGVLRPEFRFPDTAELWVPLATSPDEAPRQGRIFTVLARLEAGTSPARASRELRSVTARLAEEHPETNAGWSARAVPLREFRSGRLRPLAVLLQAAVALVLVLACANVANLLLQRAVVRERELALRAALGAGRGRLIRQLLTESLVLALAGGLLGVALSRLLLGAVAGSLPFELPRYVSSFETDARVLAFTLALCGAAAIVFGLVPAIRSSRPDLRESLSEGTTRSSGGPGRRRLRTFLVSSEVGLSLALLIAAGLMVKSFLRLQEVDPGFEPDNVLTTQMSLPENRYGDGPQRLALLRELLERSRSLPGVRFAGAAKSLPLGRWTRSRIAVEGQGPGEEESSPQVGLQMVGGDYFRALGLPILRGRDFEELAPLADERLAVVNQKLAHRLWPDGDPEGRRIRLDALGGGESWLTVVGVASDTRRQGLDADVPYDVYVPLEQATWHSVNLFLSTDAAALSLAGALRGEVAAIDAELPAADLRTLAEVLEDSLWFQRVSSRLLILFAAIATTMSAVGLYGSMAYSVSQRRHEIGIRMTLGAQVRDVLSAVVRRGLVAIVAGLASGLAVAFVVSRFLARLLFEVSTLDGPVFLGATALVGVVSLLASYLPALSASRLDPVATLRSE